MSRSPRIMVLGYNAWDVNLPTRNIPGPDTKFEVDRIRCGGGGPGATAAFAMARLGAVVKLATQLGDDLPGRQQREELTSAGVDLSPSKVSHGYESPKAVILVNPESGSRTIYWARGDLPELTPDRVDLNWLADVELFYTDGHETLAACKLAAEARRCSLPVVMDAGSVREGSAAVVELATDVISSEIFAPTLTGSANPADALRELRSRGPRLVAMTFGARGVLALVGQSIRHIPAFDVPVVDTTGAGDAFHAGYAFARATGRGFVDCLVYGAAVAGLKCRDWGGRQGLPTAPEVEELIQNGAKVPLSGNLASFVD